MKRIEIGEFAELIARWSDEALETQRQAEQVQTFEIMRPHAYGKSEGLERAANALADVLLELGQHAAQMAHTRLINTSV